MDDRQRREQIRRRKKKKAMKRKRMLRNIILACFALILLGLAFLIFWKPVHRQVTLEVGEEIELNDFLKKEKKKATFVTDINEIDTTALGEHKVVVKVGFRKFKSTLKVEDTVAPTADAAEVKAMMGQVPEASDCVTNIVDKTNVTVSYKTEPDVSAEGDTSAIVLLTDEAGNVTEVEVPVVVWCDKVAPTIEGAKTIEVTIGGTVSYRQAVTVKDDIDPEPKLSIDSSRVDLNRIGFYEVVFTATDASGNSTSVSAVVNVVPKEESGNITEQQVLDLAKKVLDRITNDSMTDREVAFAIYKWTNKNIGYVGTSDKSSWLKGAHQAFTKQSGDCYNYFAAAKAMYKVAGIDNIDVVKSDTSHSSHYWSLINLGTGWYHVDCTPRKGDGDLFFMVTDAELEKYSKAHGNTHIFDTDAYPARATESIQSEIKY